MDPLNLDHLRTFAHVIELGSFSAAADRLDLSQPAVSLQIKQLEARLGVRLIERVGKRATPTLAGSELLLHARHIEECVADAINSMAQYSTGAVGRVRLGTGPTACIYLLPPLLRELKRRLPSLEIVVSTKSAMSIVKSLEENTLDIGLITLPVYSRAFDIIPILKDELMLVAPTDSSDLPRTMSAANLSKLPLVFYDSDGQTRKVIDRWFAQADMTPKPVMELGNVEAIKELVGAGLGYAILPKLALGADKERVPLIARSLSPRCHREIGIVVRRDKPLTRGLREMLNMLKSLESA